MIKFENTQVVGWEPAIRGMRNPMNSWSKSDSGKGCQEVYGSSKMCSECSTQPCIESDPEFIIGPADHDLMMRLAAGGPVHAKYRRMIVVYVDVTAPLYWWKEYETYKVGTVSNSCSTMHKIQAKEFTLDDFSHEHLDDETRSFYSLDGLQFEPGDPFETEEWTALDVLKHTIAAMNFWREQYNLTTQRLKDETLTEKERKHFTAKQKRCWWQMIQLLPSSYNQKRTVMMNYEVLHNIYVSRKDHKLDEWRVGFIDWIKSLPYSELITSEKEETVTWQQVLEDFKERYPGYAKHVVDYRPIDRPFVIKIWLDVTNAVTGSDTIMYDYTTKTVSL